MITDYNYLWYDMLSSFYGDKPWRVAYFHVNKKIAIALPSLTV